ncbi:MAG: hydroxyisourate hydrolase [Bryobacteraceae bacterium]|nr:hydroxyisourate hydrolase [Bryobacteraceae bacterium]
MGRLSTHVLDTALGRPASGLVLHLHRLSDSREHLKTATTNQDGRTDEPLLLEAVPGTYELTFLAGDYLRAKGYELAEPAFLDEVVIRFGIATGNYHVPLLLSPYGYSTYRGS